MCISQSHLGTTCLIKRRIIELINTADSFTDKFSPFTIVPLLPSEMTAKILVNFGELPLIEENSSRDNTLESDAY